MQQYQQQQPEQPTEVVSAATEGEEGNVQSAAFAVAVPGQQSRSAAMRDFTERATHALLIVLSLFYLRVTLLSMKALQCAEGPDPTSPNDFDNPGTRSLYLIEDGQTECYTGKHMALVGVVAVLFLLYTAGFPVFCFILLTRAFASHRDKGLISDCVASWSCLRGSGTQVEPGVAAAIQQLEAQIAEGEEEGKAEKQQQREQPQQQQRMVDDEVRTDEAAAAGAAVPTTPKADSCSSGPTPLERSRWAQRSQQRLHARDSDPGEVKITARDRAVAIEIRRQREASYGFLFIGFRSEFYYSCLQVFLVQCFYASVSVNVQDSGAADRGNSVLKLFLLGMICALQACVVAVQLPYILWRENFLKLLISLAQLAHAGFMLGMQEKGFQSPYFYSVVLVFSAILMGAIFRNKCKGKKKHGGGKGKLHQVTKQQQQRQQLHLEGDEQVLQDGPEQAAQGSNWSSSSPLRRADARSAALPSPQSRSVVGNRLAVSPTGVNSQLHVRPSRALSASSGTLQGGASPSVGPILSPSGCRPMLVQGNGEQIAPADSETGATHTAAGSRMVMLHLPPAQHPLQPQQQELAQQSSIPTVQSGSSSAMRSSPVGPLSLSTAGSDLLSSLKPTSPLAAAGGTASPASPSHSASSASVAAKPQLLTRSPLSFPVAAATVSASAASVSLLPPAHAPVKLSPVRAPAAYARYAKHMANQRRANDAAAGGMAVAAAARTASPTRVWTLNTAAQRVQSPPPTQTPLE
jgi:hypothetical protein